MITGDQIRSARKRAGLSQAELARKVGVVPRTIGGWERGENTPGIAEPRLLEVLRDYFDESSAPPLQAVSDVELLAEIARRFARTTKVDQGQPLVVHYDDDDLDEHVDDEAPGAMAARRVGRAPAGEMTEEERAVELGLEVVRPAQERGRRDAADLDENHGEGVTGG